MMFSRLQAVFRRSLALHAAHGRGDAGRTCGKPLHRAAVLVCAALFSCVWLATGAQAAPVESRLVESRYVRLTAPGATCVAVNASRRLLAVGFGDGAQASLWLLKLDGKGDVVPGDPVIPELPVEDGGGRAGYPVALAFHARLPLLYVWRHAIAPGGKDPVPAGFDHLVVFDLSDAGAVKVAATAGRGQAFSAGVRPAAMTLDPEDRRLFVPNLRIRPSKGDLRPAVGYFPLDPSGMPLMEDGRAQVVFADVTDFQPLPNGRGFLSHHPQVLLMAVQGGVLTWNTADRRARLSRVQLPGLENRAGLLGGDADWFYLAGEATGILRAMRHADGYPSLLPQSYAAEQAVFRSAPLRVYGKLPGLVIGGDNLVYWIGLNAEGGFGGTDARIPFPGGGAIRVLGYSKAHDRVYIPAEREP